jgi:hypothetical protein
MMDCMKAITGPRRHDDPARSAVTALKSPFLNQIPTGTIPSGPVAVRVRVLTEHAPGSARSSDENGSRKADLKKRRLQEPSEDMKTGKHIRVNCVESRHCCYRRNRRIRHAESASARDPHHERADVIDGAARATA